MQTPKQKNDIPITLTVWNSYKYFQESYISCTVLLIISFAMKNIVLNEKIMHKGNIFSDIWTPKILQKSVFEAVGGDVRNGS